MAATKKTVRWKHLTASLSQFSAGLHKGSWRIRYKNREGRWLTGGVYKDLEKAEDEAEKILEKIDQDIQIEDTLSADELRIVKLIREHNVTVGEIESWCEDRELFSCSSVAEVISQYLSLHVERQDFSKGYENGIRHSLRILEKKLGWKEMRSVTVTQLEAVILNNDLSAKSQNNMRGVFSKFWKWAVHRSHCAENVAEKVPLMKVKKKAGGHEVLTPRELALMLKHCPEPYIPWLVISAFAGLRASEIIGRTGDRSNALRWSDFHFDRENPVIVVRPETSKTNQTRIVPICDALMDWLEPWKGSTGFVHLHARPSSSSNPVTKMLGDLIGGWRSNCLRASRASYRVAQTQSLSLTALEMGHTEAMLKTNYLNPRFEEDAAAWWGMTRKSAENLLKQANV